MSANSCWSYDMLLADWCGNLMCPVGLVVGHNLLGCWFFALVARCDAVVLRWRDVAGTCLLRLF
eukprot:114330-Amphidinium_carterae.1